MTSARGFVLGRKSPFSFEHFLLRKEEKNAPCRTDNIIRYQGIFCHYCVLCSVVGSAHPSPRDLRGGRRKSVRGCECIILYTRLQHDIS